MELVRVLNNPGTDTVYVWDRNKKRWLLTPDVTIPVLESRPPPDGGLAAINVYKDTDSGHVVMEFENNE